MLARLLGREVHMTDLKRLIWDVPDFPKPGILFRDISPLLRSHFAETIDAMDSLFTADEWRAADAVAGIESRGFILAAAMAVRRGKGFVPIRKQGKLPPPVVDVPYALEYGTGVLEMQRGEGQLLIVDDVLATGGTLAASATLARIAGYDVMALGVLIDLKLLHDFAWEGMGARAAIEYGGT
jgi:adenine phosphoribosyltransferase